MSQLDHEILPLRDLRRSDWLLRGLFVLFTILAVASQFGSEISDWLYGSPSQSSR